MGPIGRFDETRAAIRFARSIVNKKAIFFVERQAGELAQYSLFAKAIR